MAFPKAFPFIETFYRPSRRERNKAGQQQYQQWKYSPFHINPSKQDVKKLALFNQHHQVTANTPKSIGIIDVQNVLLLSIPFQRIGIRWMRCE